MDFQVRGLQRMRFATLFGLSDEQLAARGVQRCIADKSATSRYPCRVSLRDAERGESVLLLNFEHLPAPNPYRSSYAIYVSESAEEAKLAVNEIPEVMRNRPLSLRAFDASGMLMDADLAMQDTLAPTLERLLGVANVQTVHVHNARHGCYVAEVRRV